jgi:hypothetical protein
MKPTAVSRIAVVVVALLATAACESDRVNAPHDGPAKIRIVNSVFQYLDAANVAARTAPRAIDVLIDSQPSSPGAVNIAPTSVHAIGADSSAYVELPNGIHSFVARLAGQTSATSQLFTNTTNNQPYLPRQYLAPRMPYTLVVAGIAPVTAAPGTVQQATPGTAFVFSAVVDDPFPPQQVNGAYQARFRVINAAPFAAATGAGVTISTYLTSGTTAPTTVAGLTQLGGALYRNGTAYFNVAPGAYVLTLTSGTTILAQSPVTFGAGELRTFVLQSTGFAATPGPANHRITSLLDAKF